MEHVAWQPHTVHYNTVMCCLNQPALLTMEHVLLPTFCQAFVSPAVLKPFIKNDQVKCAMIIIQHTLTPFWAVLIVTLENMDVLFKY